MNIIKSGWQVDYEYWVYVEVTVYQFVNYGSFVFTVPRIN